MIEGLQRLVQLHEETTSSARYREFYKYFSMPENAIWLDDVSEALLDCRFFDNSVRAKKNSF